MPEYSAPGVYVDETSNQIRHIEPAAMGVVGFVAPLPSGPIEATCITSMAELAATYGLEDTLRRVVHGFFENGGRTLWVARVEDATTLASWEAALECLGPIEDISVVAAPGATEGPLGAEVRDALVRHVEAHDRLAVLDAPDMGVEAWRAAVDSPRAAIYHPGLLVREGDSLHRVPPSGHVCARFTTVPIHQAPVGPLAGVEGVTVAVDENEHAALNIQGINVIRYFPQQGVLIWGARLASANPDWRYVHLRRTVDWIERSLARGLLWVVFEPNGEPLWANVCQTAGAFLGDCWRQGMLLGTTPGEAFFVRCDRSTMTQNDLDNGRLVVLMGVALLRPAEFTIFRLGFKTADAVG